MAMRLYTKDEFEAFLENQLDLTKTEEVTETTELWRTSTGKYVTIPQLADGDSYPDYLLNTIYHQLKQLPPS